MNGSSATEEPRAFAVFVAVAALVAVLSALIYGFDFGIDNNEFHAAIVYKVGGVAALEHDALAQTLGSFASPFWLALGLVSRWMEPRAVFLVFFLASRFLLALGLGYVTASLTDDRIGRRSALLAAVVTLCAGFVADLPLGADPPTDTYLSQTFFSYGPCLLALGAALNGKHRWSAFALGLAYNINLMQANFALAMVAAAFAVDLWRRRDGAIRQTLEYALVVLVVASPTIVWSGSILAAAGLGPAFEGRALVDFAKYYFASHYFFLGKSAWAQSMGLSLACIPIVLSLSSGIRVRHQLAAMATVPLALFCSDAVFEIMGPGRVYFALHVLRSDVFAFALAVAALCAATMTLAVSRNWLAAAYAIGLAAVLAGEFRGALLVSALAVLVEYEQRHIPASETRRWWRTVALRAIAVCMSVGLAAAAARNPRATGLLLCAAAPALILVRQWRTVTLAGAVVAAVGGGYLLWNDGVTRINAIASHRLMRAEAEQICLEAARVLPRNALVAIPPSWTVRAFLRRSVYVNYKEGAAYLWSKGFELDYLRRLKNVGVAYTPGVAFDGEKADVAYADAVPKNLAVLRGDGVTHVILDRRHAAQLGSACVVESSNYCVTAIGRREGSPRSSSPRG
jgi:hypothetical protein